MKINEMIQNAYDEYSEEKNFFLMLDFLHSYQIDYEIVEKGTLFVENSFWFATQDGIMSQESSETDTFHGIPCKRVWTVKDACIRILHYDL